jgi:ubiquinone/menaquinone biosynthesis C-methylase UbiE
VSETRARAVAGFAAWAAAYDQTVAEEVERLSGMPYAEVLQRVCTVARPAPGARVLDVGTGTGALALAIGQTLEDVRLVGIDPTPQMLARARENADDAGLTGRIEFLPAAAEALPFADASFDVVVSSIAMHHTRVRQSLCEIVRVLRPGGRLAIADMARNPRWESTLGILLKPLLALYYLASKHSWAMMRAELAAYQQLYLQDDWEAMLREAGLQAPDVQVFPHPTSDWYSGILIISASKHPADESNTSPTPSARPPAESMGVVSTEQP